MKRALAFALLLAVCCVACKANPAVTPFHEITSAPATPAATVWVTPSPSVEPTPTAAPVPTPTPVPLTATLGFVGDIMAMNVQIANAKTADGYDFSRSFAPMAAVFSSVDYLCGNFECTLAGEAAGYSLPRQTAPPATEADPTPKAPMQKFNAPDELAQDIKKAGFDLLSCANNHCMDKGIDGLFRTASLIRAAGMMQVGTYLDPTDALTPRVAQINGIRVGFVSATDLINSGVPALSAEEKAYAVMRLSDMETIAAQIAACRAAGAEFVVAFVHWGEEHSSAQNKTQEKLADALIAAGADAIVGTHPHVVQSVEWRVAERDGATVRVPVIYSLGNFISNMAQKNVNYGAFVRLTLTKSASGEVRCSALAYLPLLCYRDGVHAVKPCFFDETGESQKAFAHVRAVCGENGINLITRKDLLNDAGEASVDQSAQ